MNRALTEERLVQETLIHRGTGGFVRGGRFYSREDAGRLARCEIANACA